MLKRLLLTVAFLIISIEFNFAAIPQKISYQGVLKNSATGIVVPDGTYSMLFALYSASSGGSAVWSETQPSVQVTQGVFSVELGSVTPIPTSLDYNNPFYLGVSFNGGSEMIPRVAINMAPYSSNAIHSNNADNTNAIRGVNVSSATPKAGDLLKFDGTNWVPTKPEVAVCRWNVFDTYEANDNDGILGNNSQYFCGVSPTDWAVNSGTLAVSNSKDVLRTFFTRKSYAKSNSLIYSEKFYATHLYRGRMVLACFRVKNTTGSTIKWDANFTYTALYNSVASSNYAYVFLDGSRIWNATASGNALVEVSIPATSTHTVIFASASSGGKSTTAPTTRSCRLAFTGNSLVLPSGLEFVDDLDED